MSDRLLPRITDQAQSGLDAAQAEIRKLDVPRVSTKLVNRPASPGIVEVAKEDPSVDLIVRGTHGRTGIGRILLGSIAEAVVRRAPCPVLTIRDNLVLRPFKHVLCPVDFSPRARDAMNLAGELACVGGAGITLLHIVELPTVWGELRPYDADRELGRRAGAQLKEWAAELAARVKVPVTTRIAVGSPGAELPEVLGKDLSFDLVVIGSHGRTGLSRMALGSIAEKVVHRAPCPVLVTHTRA